MANKPVLIPPGLTHSEAARASKMFACSLHRLSDMDVYWDAQGRRIVPIGLYLPRRVNKPTGVLIGRYSAPFAPCLFMQDLAAALEQKVAA